MTPYYSDDLVSLYFGDCRDLLPALDGNVVDVTIADPPYGETSLEWDRWVHGWPALIPGNALWCFGSMRMFLEHGPEFASWRFAQDVIWEKHNGSGFHADRFKRVHECIAQWYRGSWEALRHEVPTRPALGRRYATSGPDHTAHMGGVGAKSYRKELGDPMLMRSVIEIPSCHGYAQHPTQKPTGIIAPLIEYSSPPGGVVLDPFAGSGSTLVAAKQLGRRAIGIEARENYCQIAAGRLAQEALAL